MLLSACVSYSPETKLTRYEHGISEFMLDNGLKLIVSEDHRAPLVVSQVWYRVGAADEHVGITGISHILEHMMFKGTKKYSRQAFTETIQRHGGRDNAFTGSDYTAYFQVFEKSYFPISFDLESDRMVNLILREEDFDKERNVVKEERRWRTDDKPIAKLHEHLSSIALDQSPYQNPVIGWMNDIDNISLDDLKDWYQKWYAPNNATVVVVGDVDPADVFAQTQKYFGNIPARELPMRKPREERLQAGERRSELIVPAAQPHIALAYRVPRIGDVAAEWHPYALMVLSELLSGTRSSRFVRRLVRGKEIAQYVSASYSPYSRYDDLFSISAAPVVGVAIETLEQGIKKEIQEIRDKGIRADELAPIKAGLISHEVFRQDSIRHQAYMLGSFETIGIGWDELFRLRDKINAVTPEQVREVVGIYFAPHNRTVATLKPQKPEGK